MGGMADPSGIINLTRLCEPRTAYSRVSHFVADVVYAMCFSRIVDKWTLALELEGISCVMDKARGVPPLSFGVVSYHDDTLHGVVVDNPHNIVPVALRAATATFHVFSAFGLAINFSKGKTECLPIWGGKNARSAARHLQQLDFCCPMEMPGLKVCLQLHFVDVYKHVGSQFAVYLMQIPKHSISSSPIAATESSLIGKHL